VVTVRAGDVAAAAGLASRAGCVRAVAAAHAAAAESSRRLSHEVAEALTEAGFARHFVPGRWGGTAGLFAEVTTALAEVGEGCASAAWCGAIYSFMGRIAAYLPEEGQHDIWGDTPDRRVCGSLTPAGQAAAVRGGWQLSGRWPLASAAHSADWALLGVLSPQVGGLRRPSYAAVPRSAFEIIDSWDSVGLRGTGSHTIAATDVFVPLHRTVPLVAVRNGRPSGSPAHCHNVPLKAVNGLSFVAPALGSARAALAAWSAWISGKREGDGAMARDKASAHLALARSSGWIDAAALLLDRSARAADLEVLTPFDVARHARDYSVAISLLTRSVDELFREGGARAQNSSNPVQQAWRDVNCAAGHLALRLEPNAAAYAAQVWARAGRASGTECAPVPSLTEGDGA
jgi:two-component flavin-dependent monooxygenase